jgi:hypothetical protein
MTAIVAGILALIMIVGGILPIYSNNSLEESLKVALNNPPKVKVRVYSTPSYKILGGHYDRVEITAIKPKFADLEFDSLKIVTSPVSIDYAKANTATGLEFIKEGKLETMLILSPENMAKKLDLQALTGRINNFLANFQLPVPVLSGNVSVDGLKLSFKNNQPELSGNLIALGGMVSAPFNLTGQLIVDPVKNTVEIYNPQLSVFDEPLPAEQLQELVKFINPILDINKFNNPNMKLELKRAYFKDNKLKIIGLVTLKN